MKILVIGGTGNISSFFVKLCLKKKINVEIITRNSKNNLRDNLNNKFLQKTYCDINKIKRKNFLKTIKFKKFDCVVNFVCYNKKQAINFAHLIRNITSRFIFISTTAGYIKDKNQLPYNEQTNLKTKWIYANNKKEAEKVFLKKKNKNFNVNIIRLGHTYGHIIPFPVGPVDWTIPHLLNKGYPIIVHDKGLNTWSLLHAKDAANAIFEIIKNRNIFNNFINIVSSKKNNWNKIVKEILLILKKKKKIKYINSNIILKKCRYFGESVIYHKKFNEYYDTSLLKKIIPKWKEKITLNEGLKKTLKWFKLSKNRQIVNKKNLELLESLYKLDAKF
jgi:nucleoside-diphosphate-sugar epimerase